MQVILKDLVFTSVELVCSAGGLGHLVHAVHRRLSRHIRRSKETQHSHRREKPSRHTRCPWSR